MLTTALGVPREANGTFVLPRERIRLQRGISVSELLAQAYELAKHSLRVRLYLQGLARSPRGYTSAIDQLLLRRLLTDVKLRLAIPVEPWIAWPFEREPRNDDEAIRYLQRPELLDTENFQAMRAHARYEGCTEELLSFVSRVLSRALDFSIPLFAERLWVSQEDWTRDYVTGIHSVPGSLSPYCHGRAVLFGHAGASWFPEACASWLRALARNVAAELRCSLGLGAIAGEFVVADGDGVVCDPDCPLPFVSGVVERDALGLYLSGRLETVPWDCEHSRKSRASPWYSAYDWPEDTTDHAEPEPGATVYRSAWMDKAKTILERERARRRNRKPK